jgi:hypothetical protein
MSDDLQDDLPSPPQVDAAPANQPLHLVPTAVVPAGEQEVAAMLAEQARFNDEPEMKAVASRLLGAGYTVHTAARRLGLRASTVWTWSKEPEMAEAIAAGAERRRSVLGQGLEEAAEQALGTLLEVANDVGAQPKDRVKASEAILDRCGIVPNINNQITAVGVTVDVDFDERLARIVAGAGVKTETE